jgi:hypothetical protein
VFARYWRSSSGFTGAAVFAGSGALGAGLSAGAAATGVVGACLALGRTGGGCHAWMRGSVSAARATTSFVALSGVSLLDEALFSVSGAVPDAALPPVPTPKAAAIAKAAATAPTKIHRFA